MLGVGTSLGNPLDAGFAALSSSEAYFRCIEVLQQDPNIDVLILQEELPPAPRLNNKVENLKTVDKMVADGARLPIAIVSMISYMYTEHTKTFRQELKHLPVLQEVDKALKAVGRAGRYGALRALAASAPAKAVRAAKPDIGTILIAAEPRPPKGFRTRRGGFKELLRAYGIAIAARNHRARASRAPCAPPRRSAIRVVLKLLSAEVHAQVRHRRRHPRHQAATTSCAPPTPSSRRISRRRDRARSSNRCCCRRTGVGRCRARARRAARPGSRPGADVRHRRRACWSSTRTLRSAPCRCRAGRRRR